MPVVLSLQHLETEMLCKQHNQHFSGRKSSVITDVVRESMNEYNVCLMDEPVVIPNSLFLSFFFSITRALHYHFHQSSHRDVKSSN